MNINLSRREWRALNEGAVMPESSETPNVVVENPSTRRRLNKAAAIGGAILGTVIVVDLAAPEFDLSSWTTPISAGFLYLTSALGFAVTIPNIPKS